MSRDRAWGLGPRVLVTGGAGFIGHELVSDLVMAGHRVTIFDNLSTADADWLDALEQRVGRSRWHSSLRVELGDIRDLHRIEEVSTDQDAVVHLASSTDIPGGAADPRLDLEGCLLGTWNVLEAMRRNGIRQLLHASSGAVYGSAAGRPTFEHAGPLLPESHYAAAKLATEALVSGFAHLYGWRALVFRFGNTIGPRTNHGVVHDFTIKLLREPRRLEILGDGHQAKPFIAVDDLVAGMRVASVRADTVRAPGSPVVIYNVSTDTPLDVVEVAHTVAAAVGLDPDSVAYVPLGGEGGWPGDTRRVDLEAGALRSLGWRPTRDGSAAVRWAAEGIARRYRRTGATLTTGLERRRWHAVDTGDEALALRIGPPAAVR